MNFSRHRSVLSRVKRGTMIWFSGSQLYMYSYTYTGKYNVLLWLSSASQRSSCSGVRWVASARESLHTKSDNFPCGIFDMIFRVRTFADVIVNDASALAWAATSSTLTRLIEELLCHKKLHRWRRLQIGANFLFCALVFSQFNRYLPCSMFSELWFSQKPAHHLSVRMVYRLLHRSHRSRVRFRSVSVSFPFPFHYRLLIWYFFSSVLQAQT